MSTDTKVAIKRMDLSKQSRLDLIVNEIMIMKESHHKNIVNFLNAYLVQNDLWVVMEYMEGGPLTDVIENNTMTEQQIATVCYEVCSKITKPYYCSHFFFFVSDCKGTRTPALTENHSSWH